MDFVLQFCRPSHASCVLPTSCLLAASRTGKNHKARAHELSVSQCHHLNLEFSNQFYQQPCTAPGKQSKVEETTLPICTNFDRKLYYVEQSARVQSIQNGLIWSCAVMLKSISRKPSGQGTPKAAGDLAATCTFYCSCQAEIKSNLFRHLCKAPRSLNS